MNMAETPLYTRRRRTNLVGLTLSMTAMTLGLIALLSILFVLFTNGFAALELSLFTKDTPAPGSEGGGLRNAIVGSLMIVGLAVLVSTPIGILAGVYLTEYGDSSKTAFHRARSVRVCDRGGHGGQLFGLCRQLGAVADCGAGGHAHHRKHAAPGAWQPA